MDNLYFKKLPSEVLPVVTGKNVVIAETASGKLYWCDSSGAKRLMSVDEEHPVNGHYIQFYGDPTPASKYGGTWTEDADYAGRTLVFTGTGFTIGEKGGEATHILAVNEMPSHGPHLFGAGGLWAASGDLEGKYLSRNPFSDFGSNGRGWNTFNSEVYPAGQNLGGGQPHNNLQPYKVSALWKRIA